MGDFSSDSALETCVFPTNFGGKFGWFPYGSRQFPGKSPGEFPREFPEIPGGTSGDFFQFFLGFTAAAQGWPPKNWDLFGGNSGGNFVKTRKSGKFDRTFSGKFSRKKFRGKFFRNFRKFPKIFVRLRKNPGILQNPLCGAGYTP